LLAAGEMQALAQRIEQRGARIEHELMVRTINAQMHAHVARLWGRCRLRGRLGLARRQQRAGGRGTARGRRSDQKISSSGIEAHARVLRSASGGGASAEREPTSARKEE